MVVGIFERVYFFELSILIEREILFFARVVFSEIVQF